MQISERRHRRQFGRSVRGQSLVEFALTLPMLLVLLLGVADFGRLFSHGIILEAAVRNAAEAAAQEYVQLARNQPPSAWSSADYQSLHDLALDSLCDEAEELPNRSASGTPPVCTMPYAAVCIHDQSMGDAPANGGFCGAEAAGAPTECTIMDSAWSAAIEQPAMPAPPEPRDPLPYVEVRACYQFTTLFNLTDVDLPFGWSISIGEVWLQRDRVFVAGVY